MSHENSAQVIQNELASEYGRRVIANSKKGSRGIFVKALVIPLIALLIILIGTSFVIANFSPATYTQAKDIIFAKVDFEKFTGQSNAINKEILDSWLILNPEIQQGEVNALEEKAQEEQTQTPLN